MVRRTKNIQDETCNNCDSENIERSATEQGDGHTPYFELRIYSCESCGATGQVPVSQSDTNFPLHGTLFGENPY